MLKPIFFIVLMVFGAAIIAGGAYLLHPKFGPWSKRIHSRSVLASPHFIHGQFRNELDTPILTGEVSMVKSMAQYVFGPKPPRLRPEQAIPSQKVNIKGLDRDQDLVIWLGHSSFYIQISGQRVLIDPVFSLYGSPVPFANRAFAGSTPYSAADFPPIDVLLVSHTHWDHLDYDSIMALKGKIGQVVVPLGVGSYFQNWGFAPDNVTELDWNTQVKIGAGLTVHVLPARHYTRRLFAENQTLWAGFALVSQARRLFFSGDSGYGPHFAKIGQEFGGFDFVALDAGQYNADWALIHMTPEEAVQAALDLGAKATIPAHAGRFTIAKHAWDEPFDRFAAASIDQPFTPLFPVVGAVLSLESLPKEMPHWWEEIK